MKKIIASISYFFKGLDKLLLSLCLLTSAFGVLMVFSAKYHKMAEGALLPSEARTMIIAIALGLILALIISLIDYDIMCKLWPVWAVLSVALMILVMAIGVAPQSRPDSRVWLDLKIFFFQPSELVKIFFIITFSTHINAVKQNINKIGTIILLAIHALIPVLLVMKSGDDGSALVFIFIAIGMIFISGIDWKYIAGILVLAVAAIPVLWVKLSEFQKARFIVIFNPEKYPDTAYQQTKGLAAIGKGGFLGTGFLKGPYTQSGAVPVSESDMIFTVIAEEFGLLGGIIALLLILAIIIRIISNGRKAINIQAGLMSYGLAIMIAAQTIINVAMCLRVGPVIGITLPFFSAGGSSSLCLYIGIGLALSVYRTNYNQKPSNFRLSSIRSEFKT
ncbi:MAG: FtsW/RodA/SpoVE family cell cycle protein [Oscillospiraceae bacterium]|nr:FtsW/RodA/SpoVE family cell cycle protein [Oscillospiraceae bacterium]